VEHHYSIGLLEKIHRPPKYPKTIRIQVAVKVLLGIPFFQEREFIFILHTLAKIAAPASLLRPYGADQGSDRLGQLLALLGKNLHSYDDQDHTNRICKGPANNRGGAGGWNCLLITGGWRNKKEEERGVKRFVRPQYLVEPQNIEGTFEER
jgi:hypothetical protein